MLDRPHVLLVTSATGPGGVWRHVLDLAQGLHARGRVAIVDLPSAAESLRSAAVEHGLRLHVPDDATSEIVHVHLANTHDRSLTRRIALARAKGRRVVVTEHLPHSDASDPALQSATPTIGATMGKRLFKSAQLAMSDAVIAVSTSSAEFLMNHYWIGPGKVHIVPNGVPVTGLDQLTVRRDGAAASFAAMGSLIRQKGFDLLIEAAAQATEPWTVDVYGHGPHRGELTERAAQLPQVAGRARICFAGWAPDVRSKFATADALVMPSRWEAMPYAALEAMVSGLPLVATDVDGLSELIINGVTGFAAQPNASDLARALDLMARSRDKWSDFGRAGHDLVARDFSLDHMIEKTSRVYEQVDTR